MNTIKAILFVVALFATTVYADPVTLPNTFTAGTPAKASEVNANFNALVNAVNGIQKPLMVYDSAGKLIGRYFQHELYGQTSAYDYVIIQTSTFSFAINYFSCYSCGSASAGGDPLTYWGYQSPFGGRIVYPTSDCSGAPFGMIPNNQDGDKMMNFAYVYDVYSAIHSSVATILSKDYIYVASAGSLSEQSGPNQFRCATVAWSGWVAPILGTFDMATLNLTPPFSVR